MEKIPLALIELDWCSNFVLICKCYVRYKIACFYYWHHFNEERLPELSRLWVVQNKVATLRENELPYPILVANTFKPLSSGPPIKRTPSTKRTLSLVPKRTSDQFPFITNPYSADTSIKGAVSRQSGSFCLILPITRPQSLWNLK